MLRLIGYTEMMDENLDAAMALLFFWLGGSLIAGMTWWFSSRPRQFVRQFVPKEDWRGALPGIKNPDYQRGMRQMAAIQLGVAGLMGMIGLWLLWRS